MKKLTRKAASLLLACALLLGLMPQPALAAGVELKYQSQGNGLYLGLTGLDEKDVIYGVQLQLTLTGERRSKGRQNDLDASPGFRLRLE